jgi:hypothetical protein
LSEPDDLTADTDKLESFNRAHCASIVASVKWEDCARQSDGDLWWCICFLHVFGALPRRANTGGQLQMLGASKG